MIRALRTLLTTRVLIKRSSRSATRSVSVESNWERPTATSSAVSHSAWTPHFQAAADLPTRSTCGADSRTGAVQFSLTRTRKATGLPVWTAPQGATVLGNEKYVFDHPVGKDDGPENTRRRDSILSRIQGAAVAGVDDPAARRG